MGDVLIISNESELFLPGAGGVSRGRRFRKLSAEETSSPTEAEDLFGGRLTEVKRLREVLSEITDADMCLVTSGHGLVCGNDRISPYEGYINTGYEMRKADAVHGIADDVRSIVSDYRTVVVLLPKAILSHLLEEGALEGAKQVIAVTTLDILPGCGEAIILPRKGARVGKQNFREICRIISGRGFAKGI